MISNRFVRGCAFALALALASSSASAATIVQTENFSGTPGFSSTLTFDQFDPSLGTLTSIFVEFEVDTIIGQLIIDNDAAQAASGTVQYGANATLSSSEVSLLNTSLLPVVGTLVASSSTGQSVSADDGDTEAGGTGNFSSVGTDSATIFSGSASDSDDGFIASAAFLTGTVGFVGTGDYDIDLNAGQIIDFGALGGVQFFGSPISAEGLVRITYNYTPTEGEIPEPTSACCLALGALAMGLYRRRTR